MSLLLNKSVQWKVLKKEVLLQTSFFSLRTEKCELPNKKILSKYYIFDCADWVQIVPTTKDGKYVMVSQYRHAAGESFFEFPGGVIDKGEVPEQAAARELLEETGYHANELVYLGAHYPNPALQKNKLHVFAAMDCQKVGKQALDEFEDIDIHLVKGQDLKQIISKDGQHALMLTSFLMQQNFLSCKKLDPI